MMDNFYFGLRSGGGRLANIFLDAEEIICIRLARKCFAQPKAGEP